MMMMTMMMTMMMLYNAANLAVLPLLSWPEHQLTLACGQSIPPSIWEIFFEIHQNIVRML